AARHRLPKSTPPVHAASLHRRSTASGAGCRRSGRGKSRALRHLACEREPFRPPAAASPKHSRAAALRGADPATMIPSLCLKRDAFPVQTYRYCWSFPTVLSLAIPFVVRTTASTRFTYRRTSIYLFLSVVNIDGDQLVAIFPAAPTRRVHHLLLFLWRW